MNVEDEIFYCSKDEAIVLVDAVSKKFSRSLRRSLVNASSDIARSLWPFQSRLRGVDRSELALRPSEFIAINNLSFRLKRGDSLALLGINGSGKTTLLRLIYGIYPIDRGRIEVRGRVGALLAAGVGFHPQMTGRENIYVNGAILGLSKQEIDVAFDEIITFADIAEFIDAPAGTYSSGMRVRLGFAIVVHADIDILIADEVLAVGDAPFRAKCFSKIHELKAKGVSIIFVSHLIDQVKETCEKSLYLKKGNLVAFGDTDKVIQLYQEDNPN